MGKIINRKVFFVLFSALIFVAFFLRVWLTSGNNLYFTVDQGRDAVFVREILENHRIFFKGPETNIRGIFAGPLVDYYLALGYFLFDQSPMGGAFVMIFTNVLLTGFLVLWLKDKIDPYKALLVGFALQFYWPFFETSLWAFHPFPLVALGFALVVLLVGFINGKSNLYYFAAIPVILAFNAEVAGAFALLLFYLLIGIYGIRKKLIPKKYLLVFAIVFALVGLFLGREFFRNTFNSQVLGISTSVDSGKNAGRVLGSGVSEVSAEFIKIIGAIAIPQQALLGVFIVLLVVVLYIRQKKKDVYLHKFILLSLVLFLVTYVFFASNQGYRSWHTVYLPAILFTSFLLMLFSLERRIAISLLIVVVLAQVSNFSTNYREYLRPNNNPSILYNQIAVVDWIYKQSNNLGFKVYNYTDTFYDYPYQYLFWWHGLKTYKYLPDEYSNYPLSPKELYIPGVDNYRAPKRSGENLKYLIIQSSTNGETNSNWIEKFKEYHNLTDSKLIGDIRIEKWERKHDAPNDPCIWWNVCIK